MTHGNLASALLAAVFCMLSPQSLWGATEVYVSADGESGSGLAYMRGGDCLLITPSHITQDAFSPVEVFGRAASMSTADPVMSWRSLDLAVLRLQNRELCRFEEEAYPGAKNKIYLRRRGEKGQLERMFVSMTEDRGDAEKYRIRPTDSKDEMVSGWSGSILFDEYGKRIGMFVEKPGAECEQASSASNSRDGDCARHGFVLKATFIKRHIGPDYGDPFSGENVDTACTSIPDVADPTADPAQLWNCALKSTDNIHDLQVFSEVHAGTPFEGAANQLIKRLKRSRDVAAVDGCRSALDQLNMSAKLDLRYVHRPVQLKNLYRHAIDLIEKPLAAEIEAICTENALIGIDAIDLKLAFPLALLAQYKQAQALPHITSLAEQSSTWALYLLAIKDLAQDTTDADLQWKIRKRLELTSNQNNYSAKIALGLYYIRLSAQGDEGLRVKGLKLLTEAADASYPIAQFLVGSYMAGLETGFERYHSPIDAQRYLQLAKSNGFQLTSRARVYIEPISESSRNAEKNGNSTAGETVLVEGAVQMPGPVSLKSSKVILRKVLMLAGGLAPGANLKKIEVVRANGQAEKRIRLTMPIRPGDRVWVPKD